MPALAGDQPGWVGDDTADPWVGVGSRTRAARSSARRISAVSAACCSLVAMSCPVALDGHRRARGTCVAERVDAADAVGHETTLVPLRRAAYHPDFHRRSWSSTRSTGRWMRSGRGLSPPVRNYTDPGARDLKYGTCPISVAADLGVTVLTAVPAHGVRRCRVRAPGQCRASPPARGARRLLLRRPRLVDGRPGHEDVGAGLGALLDGAGGDSPSTCTQISPPWRRTASRTCATLEHLVGHERLAPEAGLDRHHEDHVQLGKELLVGPELGPRLEGHAGAHQRRAGRGPASVGPARPRCGR